MSKQEDLDKIDKLVRAKMIEALGEDGDITLLRELTTPVNYLAKNNVVAEKEKSSVEEDIKKKVSDAEQRRREKG